MGLFDKFKGKRKDYTEEIIAKLGCDYLIIEEKDIKYITQN
ncbi:hypothetical protein [Bacillus pseudomycoides]